MPEELSFKKIPSVMLEFHIQPFLEEYIPGSVVLCREISNDGVVFFQIPKGTAQKMDQTTKDQLKNKVHAWWLSKEKPE